ncbi:MAG: SIMPL domain-containing protein [Chloroflexi bacterium]|nr:SIMPL domain-containing protein [Chloroflexota bacterium]
MLRSLGFLVLTVVSFFLVGCITTGAITGKEVPNIPTGISVSGQGRVTVVPDIALLQVGVETRANSVAQALGRANESMESVMRVLNEAGVAKKDIKTQAFNISPIRQSREGTTIIIGYRVSNMVLAKIRHIDQAGRIIDAAARAAEDAARIDSISFTVDDPTPYQSQAREMAVADAHAKAEQLARLAGVQLGNPVFIAESGVSVPLPRSLGAFGEKGGDLSTTPISPGEAEISTLVQITYDIR